MGDKKNMIELYKMIQARKNYTVVSVSIVVFVTAVALIVNVL